MDIKWVSANEWVFYDRQNPSTKGKIGSLMSGCPQTGMGQTVTGKIRLLQAKSVDYRQNSLTTGKIGSLMRGCTQTGMGQKVTGADLKGKVVAVYFR